MTTDTMFLCTAVLGTTLFLGRAGLMLAGVGEHHDGVYHDTDTPDGTEGSFRVLSIQTFTSFMMTFGWAGLAAMWEYSLSPAASLLVAIVVGGMCLYLTAWLFHKIFSMASEGADFRLEDLVGTTTSVYQRIPADGSGRIQASVGGMTHEIKAISEERVEIPSFELVQVVKVVDSETVSVRQRNA
jgi:hypothetical protein